MSTNDPRAKNPDAFVYADLLGGPTPIAPPSKEWMRVLEDEKSFLLLRGLAMHIMTMADDAYFNGHPEWEHIVSDARAGLLAQGQPFNPVVAEAYETCAKVCDEVSAKHGSSAKVHPNGALVSLMRSEGASTCAYEIRKAAIEFKHEWTGCQHEWSRRRDGRQCHKCGAVEFGVSA